MYRRICIVLFMVMAGVAPGLQGAEGQKQSSPSVENVDITRVAVPVRVYRNGKPVSGLSAADFTLYEEEKLREVSGVQSFRKVIRPPHRPLNPRIFILSFQHITEPTRSLAEGLKRFFREIPVQGDEIFFLAGQRRGHFQITGDPMPLYHRIMREVEKQALQQKQIRERFFQSIRQLTRTYINKMAGGTFTTSCPEIRYLRTYLQIREEYRQKYLLYYVPDFSSLLPSLRQSSERRKWMLAFCQQQVFPRLRPHSPWMRYIEKQLAHYEANPSSSNGSAFAHLLQQYLKRYRMEDQSATEGIPGKQRDLLVQTGVTVHSFLLAPGYRDATEHIEPGILSGGMETFFQELSLSTGGGNHRSENVSESLQEAENCEDILYMLYYESEGDPDILRKVTVQLVDPSYSLSARKNKSKMVLPGSRMRRHLAGIEIQDLGFMEGSLQVTIRNIRIDPRDNRGKLGVSVTGVRESDGETVYRKRRSLTGRKGKSSIALKLSFPELVPGEYTFTVSTTDFTSGEKNSKTLQVFLKD